MAILICGGAGYIGSHVNKMLNQRGYETVVIDNLIYGHIEAVKWGIFEQGDLADKDFLRLVFNKYKIDAVMHFAAYAYVGESIVEPAKYYQNNVVNSLNLLEVMREYGVRFLIFSSTCATYGIPESMPVTEDMPQNPINPYGKTKLIIERMLEDYDRAYGMKYCCLRYFNAAGSDPEGEIGEDHFPETHIIPLVLDVAAGIRDDIKIFGTDYPTRDGTCVRDYIHVMDLADAHIKALAYLEDTEISDNFNLGNEYGNSVLEVIESVKRVTGKDITVEAAPRRAGDPPELVGGNRKAGQILGWKPKYADLDVIVHHAWNWHEHKKW